MKKSTKIILPALAVLVLGTAAAATSTVAWFAANGVVEATGMQFQCATSDNLVISRKNPKTLTDGDYGKSVAAVHDAITNLYPSSTCKEQFADGTPSFYKADETVDAANGALLQGAVITEGEEGSTKEYAKYSLWLSAQSLNDMNLEIESVTVATANDYIDNALRMGVYYEDASGQTTVTKDTTTGEVTGGTAKYEVFKLTPNADASYLGLNGKGTVTTITSSSGKITDIQAKDGDAEATSITKSVTPASPTGYSLGKILSTKTATATVGDQNWSRIDLYFWYEGQDSHCTAANALSVNKLNISVSIAATSVSGN